MSSTNTSASSSASSSSSSSSSSASESTESYSTTSVEESSSAEFLTENEIELYRQAGSITAKVIREITALCKPNASIRELCIEGDNRIIAEVEKIEGNFKKGIAFPTCLNVNHCICHYSPGKNDRDRVLKQGDLVKLELGAHLDGYIAAAGKSIVVGLEEDGKITGRKADVILAAYWGLRAALHLIRLGKSTYDVTEMIQRVADSYNCTPVEGIRSFQLKPNIMNADKCVIQNPTESLLKDYDEEYFEHYEAYAIDVLMSTGKGVGYEKSDKVCIYKRTDEEAELKLRVSRALYTEASTRFGEMPFNIRHFADEKEARKGVIECVKRSLIESFPILYEKSGEYVAQFKHTLLYLPNGVHIITEDNYSIENILSEFSITEDDIRDMLKMPLISIPSGVASDAESASGSFDAVTSLSLEDIQEENSEGCEQGQKTDNNGMAENSFLLLVVEDGGETGKNKAVAKAKHQAASVEPAAEEGSLQSSPTMLSINDDQISKVFEVQKAGKGILYGSTFNASIGKVFQEVKKALGERSPEPEEKTKEELDVQASSKSEC